MVTRKPLPRALSLSAAGAIPDVLKTHAISPLPTRQFFDFPARRLQSSLSNGDTFAQVTDTQKSATNSILVPRDLGFTLTWTGISWTPPPGKGFQNTSLRQLEGLVRPGDMLAVISTTFAERAAFAEIVSGRKRLGDYDGNVLIDGRPREVAPLTNFVVHTDSMLESLTVEEVIRYSVDLALPLSATRRERVERTDRLLQDFQLEGLRHQRIGKSFWSAGISAGEKRRVLIASQMVKARPLLFLIEPTSGLDGVESAEVMRVIADVSKSYRLATVCTVHRLDSETYDQFNRLMIIANGRNIYFGGTTAAPPHFSILGHPLPSGTSAPDHYLRLISGSGGHVNANDSMQRERTTRFAREWEGSTNYYDVRMQVNLEKTMAQLAGKVNDNDNIDPLARKDRRMANWPALWYNEVRVLVGRGLVNLRRDFWVYWIRMIVCTVFAIIIGSVWWRTGTSQAQLETRLASLSLSVSLFTFTSIASVPYLLREQRVFLREAAVTKSYSTGGYALSASLTPIPFTFLMATCYSVTVYFMIGLRSGGDAFMKFSLFLWLVMYVAESLVALVTAVVPRLRGALLLTASINLLFTILQGFLIRKSMLAEVWYWIHLLDYQAYGFEAVVIGDLKNSTFSCEQSPSSSPSQCYCLVPSSLPAERCAFSGDDVIAFYHYSSVTQTAWALVLLDMAVVFRLLYCAVLRWKVGDGEGGRWLR